VTKMVLGLLLMLSLGCTAAPASEERAVDLEAPVDATDAEVPDARPYLEPDLGVDAATEPPAFTVVGTTILDPEGRPFVPLGVNLFPDRDDSRDLIVDCWRFNTVRINHLIDWPWYDLDTAVAALVEAFTPGVVVVLDLAHDAEGEGQGLGYYWTGREAELEALYARFAERYRENPWVWFDLINEPGQLEQDADAWLGLHGRLIRTIRGTGNTAPVIVEGWAWGQDAGSWDGDPVPDAQSAILSLGPELLGEPGFAPLVFSVHVYDQWRAPGRLADYVRRVQARGMALWIGEYGSVNNDDTMAATREMFDVVGPAGVGHAVWQWHAQDPNDLTTDEDTLGGGDGLDDCQTPSNLTPLGRLVWAATHP